MLPGPQGLEATSVAAGSVGNAGLANMAADTIKGRADGAGTGAPQDLTADQVRTIENTSTLAAKFLDVQIEKTAPAISAGVLTLDLSLGNCFAVSLNANVTTLTISNPAASGKLASCMVMFTADGTLRTVAAPTGGVYPGGAAPVMTSTLNKRDWLQYMTFDGGATWFIFTLGQNF